MSGFIGFIGFVLLVVGVIALFKPFKGRYLGRKGAWVSIVVGVLLGAASSGAAPKVAPAAVAVVAPAVTSKEAAQAVIQQVTSASGACDQAGSSVSDVISSGDRYAAYPLVLRAKTVCLTAAQDVGKIQVGSEITEPARQQFRDAVSDCEAVYRTKSRSFRTLGEVLDGDVRPSKMAEAEANSNATQAGIMRCSVGLISAAMTAGLTVEEATGVPANG